VLEWIDVAIFDMSCVIGVIADEMLPKPPLPDAALLRERGIVKGRVYCLPVAT
jgi:hypothetical protein